jgi:hypothetical protein
VHHGYRFCISCNARFMGIPYGQAPQMQVTAVRMPVLGHRPGPARAASPPEPGARETDLDSVSAGPRWHGRSARMRVRERMHETGGKQANQSTEAACGHQHSTRNKQPRLHATSLARGRLAPGCRPGCREMRTKRARSPSVLK